MRENNPREKFGNLYRGRVINYFKYSKCYKKWIASECAEIIPKNSLNSRSHSAQKLVCAKIYKNRGYSVKLIPGTLDNLL